MVMESRITVGVEEMHLKKVIAESREIAQAINEFADTLEQIERKYEDVDDGNIEREDEQKQKDDKIRVGDEVYIISENNKSVVTHIFNAPQGSVAMLLSGDAKWIDVELQYLNKTGKHYDAIEEVLKELRR